LGIKENNSQLLIIDGHALVFRAYYAFQTTNMKNSKTGSPSGAVFGFFRMFFKLLNDYPSSHIAFTFDPGTQLERNKIFPDYKGTRKPMPEDLKPQIREVMEIVKELGYPLLLQVGHEADDIIGSLCKKFGEQHDIVICSGDKDLYQLLMKKNIKMLRGKKGTSDFIIINSDWVVEELGITPDEITDYMGIVGDTSDNIPGVKGIGEKGASSLIKEYKNLESIYSNLENIKNPSLKEKLVKSKEMAFLSRNLATLKTDLKIEENWEDLKTQTLTPEKIAIFQDRGYNVIHRDLSKDILGKLPKEEKETKEVPSPSESNKKGKYRRIKNKKELKELVVSLSKYSELSVDTETTSPLPMDANLLGISISWAEGEGVYIPVKYSSEVDPNSLLPVGSENKIQDESLDVEDTISALKKLLENPKINKIGQNIKYDFLVLQKYDVLLSPIYFDTMIAGYILKPDVRRHNMDDLAMDYLNYKTITYDELTGVGKKRKALYDIDLDSVTEYAAEDADITFRLYNKLKNEISAQDPVGIFSKIEIPLIEVLAEIEKTGVSIDSKYFHNLSIEFKKEMQKIEKKIYASAKKEFNINSTKELQKILFEDLKLDIIKKNKTGLSTDHSVLEALSGKHEIIDALLDHRKYSKLISTYVDSLPEMVNKTTNRIHTSYNQTIAATGRLSSTDPNLQNIPIKDKEGRMIRKGFIPISKDFELLSLDYSQIELRIMAHFSKDKNMIEAYEKGLDIHARTASALFSVPEEEVNAEMRNKAKVVNFSVIYGTTAFGLAENLKISRTEAGMFIDKYFYQYPGVKNYMEKISSECFETGYVETLSGRRRYIPLIKSSRRQEVEAAKRIAINSPIQGTSADLIKKAMLDIHAKIKKSKFKSRMILQVHDELVFEVHTSEKEKIYNLAKKSMEEVEKLDVPLEAKGKFGKNWDEAH